MKQTLIIGPCSAESYEQLESTLQGFDKSLFDAYDVYFRAGCWKPRTMPGQFEGYGEEALAWLKQLKDKYNVKICTEIANAQHLQLALQYDIDAVWIGARTVTDVFSMTALAAHMPANLPVFVKNPMSADLALWVGGIKRLSHCTNLFAIHRGFTASKYESTTKYRNVPVWDIVKDLKHELPGLHVLFDPSHVAGDVRYLNELMHFAASSQMYSGYMIESHYCPEKALTDSKQQIKPDEVAKLLHQTVSLLDFERCKIDEIDEEIVALIAKRRDVVMNIARKKAIDNKPIKDVSRRTQVYEHVQNVAAKHNLPKYLITDIWEKLHDYFVHFQKKLNES